MKIIYHQINIANIELEIENLNNLQNEEFFIIGIEITDPDLAIHCSLNIDPQHDNNIVNNITSLEYLYNSRSIISDICKIFEKIAFITIKPDLDSIATICLIELLLIDEFKLDNNLVLKLKSLANSDRHGRLNYKKKQEDYFNFGKRFNIYGIPVSLINMISDFKLELDKKIDYMKQYLFTSTFDVIEKYTSLNKKKDKKNKFNLTTIIPSKLVFVKSYNRGAISHGYKKAPVVIAKNNSFNFGFGDEKKVGKKITIAQFEADKYIDLNKLKDDLNKLESGWGGSNCIIGSPQTNPCKLSDDIIIDLTSKYIKV